MLNTWAFNLLAGFRRSRSLFLASSALAASNCRSRYRRGWKVVGRERERWGCKGSGLAEARLHKATKGNGERMGNDRGHIGGSSPSCWGGPSLLFWLKGEALWAEVGGQRPRVGVELGGWHSQPRTIS